jgi:hypothetical protein
VDGTGKEYQFFVESWEIVENGIVCGILEGNGHMYATDGQKRKARMRLSFHQGKAAFEMAFQLVNDSDYPLSVKKLVLAVSNPGKGERTTACVASSNYMTSFHLNEEGDPVERVVCAEDLLYESNEHMAEVLYGTLFSLIRTVEGGVCATVFQAQQNFPKAVQASRDGLQVFLVPEGVGKVVLQPGMAREQKVQIELISPSSGLEEVSHSSLLYQMPDRPWISPEVYQEADVFPDVFVRHTDPDVEMALLAKGDAHSRCYGMLNWGDSPDPGYTMQGRGNGRLVWTNNEYDFPHACAVQYARTGIRRFLDYVLVSGRHWIDVDVCHYSKNPLIMGGQWEHCDGHAYCPGFEGYYVVECSHEWVEGLLDYYHFTGEKEALTTAVGIGENVLRLLEGPMFQQTGEINARETGWAMRTLTALYIETNDEKWLEKCEWIVGHFEEWAEEFGGWFSPYTDNTAIRVPFMIAVAVGSLMRYYRVRPQEKLKKMILGAVDDLVEHAYMEQYRVFYYKELPSLSRLGNNTLVLEALAIATELSGDRKYLEYGRKTFERAIHANTKGPVGQKRIVEDAVVVDGDGTKDFAQSFLPLATYYKSVADGEDEYDSQLSERDAYRSEKEDWL